MKAVERVSRAICRSCGHDPESPGKRQGNALRWMDFAKLASAAIAAMGASSRQNDQLAAMWVGIVQPLADQAWIGGRQYSPEVWHEFLKRQTIPAMLEEQEEPGQWIKPTAHLWRYMPDGSREFCGSTAMLTKRGMSVYLQRIEAYAVSEHGVKLPVNPRDI